MSGDGIAAVLMLASLGVYLGYAVRRSRIRRREREELLQEFSREDRAV